MDYELIVEVYCAGPVPPEVTVWRRYTLLNHLSEEGWTDEELERLDERMKQGGMIILTDLRKDPDGGERTLHFKNFSVHTRTANETKSRSTV